MDFVQAPTSNFPNIVMPTLVKSENYVQQITTQVLPSLWYDLHVVPFGLN